MRRRRLVLRAIGLAALASGLGGGPGLTETPAPRLRYADDLADPIVASIYSLPSAWVGPEEARAFVTAVRESAPDRDLVVLADASTSRSLASVAEPLRLHLILEETGSFSPWPRDPFSVVRGPDGGVVLHDRPGRQRGREADAGMAEAVAHGISSDLAHAWGGVRRQTAPFPFHNGHVLLAADAAWVSLHSLEPRILEILDLERVPAETFASAAGIDRYLDAADRAIDDFADLYGKPVRLVHPLPRSGPLAERVETMRVLGGGGAFDLDTLVTFLPGEGGAPSTLVGDPAAGLRLLTGLAALDWETFATTYGLDPSAGRPPEELVAYQGGDRATWLGRFLDLLARHLEAEGLAVRRLPLLLVPTGLLAHGDRFGHPDFVLGWNNVVIEPAGDRPVARGFASGLPTGDRKAAGAYEAAGVRLELLPPLVASVTSNGGYRCASNHVRLAAGGV